MTAFVSFYLYRGSSILEHVNAKIGVVQKLLDIIIYMNISLFGYVLAHLLSLKSRPVYSFTNKTFIVGKKNTGFPS